MKKYIGFIIGIVIIVTITLVYNFSYTKNHSEMAPKENENIILEETNNEISNSIEENTIENETVDNSIKETVITEQNTGSEVYEQNSDIGSTDKKQEAINLVKQKWGEDDTVTFRCDSVDNNGEYIIAVVSKTSAKVQNYFRVNIEKKSVIVDY